VDSFLDLIRRCRRCSQIPEAEKIGVADITLEEWSMSLVRELWDFMKVRKKFWLAPIIIVLVIMSALIVLSAAAPVLTPFIYPLV
jgi:hypothetical protein